MPHAPLSEEAEPDYFIVITQKENYTVGIALPLALIYRRDCNDLLTFRDESQQVLPGKIFRDGITDQISDLSLARFAIAFRHLLVTAPLAILRIEAGPRVCLVEILRIGAAHREIDVLHTPVVRGVECKDHVVTDLAPLRRRLMLRPQSPLPGLAEDLWTAIRDVDLLSWLPPETPDVEPQFISIHYFVRRAGQFKERVQAVFDRIHRSVFTDNSRFIRKQQRRILITQDLWRA